MANYYYIIMINGYDKKTLFNTAPKTAVNEWKEVCKTVDSEKENVELIKISLTSDKVNVVKSSKYQEL